MKKMGRRSVHWVLVAGLLLGCDPPKTAAGGRQSCTLLGTGDVRCWGYGQYGVLGYGNTTNIGDNETPASARTVAVGGTVTQLVPGYYHTCALLEGGRVRCWGRGEFGMLGYGNTRNIGDDETPASAGDVNVGGTVKQLAAGYYHTCALLNSGFVRCWGQGQFGQHGYGHVRNIGDDETPASAGNVSLGGRAIQIEAGGFHTCAILESGAVRCWGAGHSGQLGYAVPGLVAVGDTELPSAMLPVNVGGEVDQISLGEMHTCALLTSGKLRCWGYGEYGQLGYGNRNTIGDNEAPATAGDIRVGENVVYVSAGGQFTCVITSSLAVRCWGENLFGQLGYGDRRNRGDDELPSSYGAVNLGGRVTSLSAGYSHSCVRTEDGEVRCWGSGGGGKLGYARTADIGDDELPVTAGVVAVE
ncbi:MAG TPA: hypothetical protein VI072_32165 [Polyangiaceae bacterium]